MKAIDLDHVVCILSRLQSNDLLDMLGRTQPDRRVNVARSFADLDVKRWAICAGVEDVTIGRWVKREVNLPMWGAARLSAVLFPFLQEDGTEDPLFGYAMVSLWRGWMPRSGELGISNKRTVRL